MISGGRGDKGKRRRRRGFGIDRVGWLCIWGWWGVDRAEYEPGQKILKIPVISLASRGVGRGYEGAGNFILPIVN